MIIKANTIPFYLKAVLFLVGIYFLITMLQIAREIIVPLVFAIIIAVVLHPVINYFVKKKINRILAIVIVLLLTFIIIIGIGSLIFSQAIRFSESWPVLIDKFTAILNQTVTWASRHFEVNPQIIQQWIASIKSNLLNSSSSALGQTIMSISSGIMALFLVPVYVFMILFYEPIILVFINRLFASSNQSKVAEIVLQIKNVIQRYLIGLVIEFVIVAILNSVALLILGIDYAILLGILGALLNLIPYIGGMIGVALPMLVAFATKSTAWYALYVLIFYFIIQLIDNNYIIPKIVASKVKINALFSIIVVIAGNALWGVPGMFLSLPVLAIIKLIFDHIEPLKPWGFLLGDTMPPIIKIKIKPINLIRRKKVIK